MFTEALARLNLCASTQFLTIHIDSIRCLLTLAADSVATSTLKQLGICPATSDSHSSKVYLEITSLNLRLEYLEETPGALFVQRKWLLAWGGEVRNQSKLSRSSMQRPQS